MIRKLLQYKRYIPSLILMAAIGGSLCFLPKQPISESNREEVESSKENKEGHKVVIEDSEFDKTPKKQEQLETETQDKLGKEQDLSEISEEDDERLQKVVTEMSLDESEGEDEEKRVILPEQLAAVSRPQVVKTSSSLELEWNAVKGVEEYEIRLDEGEPVKVNENHYRLTQLQSGTRYECRVRTSIGESKGSWSQPVDIILPLQKKKETYMLIDGRQEDWQNIDGLISADCTLKTVEEEADLYLSVIGSNLDELQIAIDSDSSAATGYTGTEWLASGIDFLVSGEELYRYIGSNEEWSWEKIQDLSFEQIEVGFEVKVPLNAVSLSYGQEFNIGMIQADDSLLPAAGRYMVMATEMSERKLIAAPEVKQESIQVQTYNAALEWQQIQSALGYEVEWERTVKKTKDTKMVIGHLKPDTEYHYRVRAEYEEGAGPWSEMMTVKTSASALIGRPELLQDGSVADWSELPSLYPMGDQSIKAVITDHKLHILVPDIISQPAVYIDTDGSYETGLKLENWEIAGIDYYIEDKHFYQYEGDGESWQWHEAGDIQSTHLKDCQELIISLDGIKLPSKSPVYIGIANGENLMPSEGMLWCIDPE